MSDDDQRESVHTGKRMFLHFVFVPADNLEEEQIQAGISCLLGHASRGHGFYLCDPMDFLAMLESPGGVEKITAQLMKWRDLMESGIADVKVDMSGDNDDPFGLYTNDDPEQYH